MRTYCFTGHRPDKIGGYSEHAPEVMAVKEWMKSHIVRIVEEYREVTFIVGGALGVDTWAFDVIWGHIKSQEKYRSKKYNVQVHMYLPCVDHFIKWPEHAQNKVRTQINGQADYVVWTSHDRFKGGWQMQRRNQAMVDNSDGVIAVWIRDEPGGTKNCVDYARKKQVPILGFDPRTQKQYAFKPRKRKREVLEEEED